MYRVNEKRLKCRIDTFVSTNRRYAIAPDGTVVAAADAATAAAAAAAAGSAGRYSKMDLQADGRQQTADSRQQTARH